MASTPEGKVKKKVVAQLQKLNVYYFYPVTSGYGSSGVPDIVGCYRGRFFAIECKANGNKPTVLQTMNLNKIEGCGGVALVIDEANVADVTKFLNAMTYEDKNG